MKFKISLILSDRKLKVASIVAALLYLFSSTAVPVFATVSYSYEANGNMSSDGTNCFSYNDNNQLSQVTNCSSGKMVAAYTYDYQGNRISSKSYDINGNLVKTTYTPTQGYETVKLASNSAILNTTYYYVNGKLVARKNPDNSKSYILSDNLNSTSVVTDQNGHVLENTSYYPFGAIRSGGTQSKQLFTGQRNDPETGLDYYNSRYYNSHIARFTQPDTLIPNIYNPQSLNRYSYVLNNPLRYTDPTGHWGEQLLNTPYFLLGLIAVALTAALETHPVQHAISATLSYGFNNWQNFWNTVNNHFGINNENRQNNIKEPQSSTPRGSNNPATSNAIKIGQQAHAQYDYGSGFQKEVNIGNGMRVDAINNQTHEIIELKPNTPSGRALGVKQLQGYIDQANSANLNGHNDWTGHVEYYNPSDITKP